MKRNQKTEGYSKKLAMGEFRMSHRTAFNIMREFDFYWCRGRLIQKGQPCSL